MFPLSQNASRPQQALQFGALCFRPSGRYVDRILTDAETLDELDLRGNPSLKRYAGRKIVDMSQNTRLKDGDVLCVTPDRSAVILLQENHRDVKGLVEQMRASNRRSRAEVDFGDIEDISGEMVASSRPQWLQKLAAFMDRGRANDMLNAIANRRGKSYIARVHC